MGRVSLSEAEKKLKADAVELARVAWEKTRDFGLGNVDTVRARVAASAVLYPLRLSLWGNTVRNDITGKVVVEFR